MIIYIFILNNNTKLIQKSNVILTRNIYILSQYEYNTVLHYHNLFNNNAKYAHLINVIFSLGY